MSGFDVTLRQSGNSSSEALRGVDEISGLRVTEALVLERAEVIGMVDRKLKLSETILRVEPNARGLPRRVSDDIPVAHGVSVVLGEDIFDNVVLAAVGGVNLDAALFEVLFVPSVDRDGVDDGDDE